MLDTINNALTNTRRLQALQQLALLDTPSELVFDKLTQLASKIIGAPVSMVSLIDADHQFMKSSTGLPESMVTNPNLPLSYSICHYMLGTGEPLIISDTRETPFVQDNLAVKELDAIGYLGMPLKSNEGDVMGSFCVIDYKPRDWTPEQIEIMRDLSLVCMSVIETRAQLMDLHQFADERIDNVVDQLAERDAEIARLKAQLAAPANGVASPN